MSSTTQETRYKGVITFFDEKRKFGFIKVSPTARTNYFFHISNIEKKFDIAVGVEVEFEKGKNEKGSVALKISQYEPVITGKFSEIVLPNEKLYLNNQDRLRFLEEENEKAMKMLDELSTFGFEIDKEGTYIKIKKFDLQEIVPESRKLEKVGHLLIEVPSGYKDTIQHVLAMLNREIRKLNIDFTTTLKGQRGEEKTAQSLSFVKLQYPVMYNIRFEETVDSIKYSAETDAYVITDKAIFIVETKNIGSKGDVIDISADGNWSIFDGQKSHRYKGINPFVQAMNHKYMTKKLLLDNGYKTNIPIVPIIAIGNDNVNFKVDEHNDIPVQRVEMLGVYLDKYLNSHPAIIPFEDVGTIKEIFENSTHPAKEYEVTHYSKNIAEICKNLQILFTYLQEDIILQEKIKEEHEKINNEKSLSNTSNTSKASRSSISSEDVLLGICKVIGFLAGYFG